MSGHDLQENLRIMRLCANDEMTGFTELHYRLVNSSID